MNDTEHPIVLITTTDASKGEVPHKNLDFELFKRIVQPGWPGLYLAGFFNLDTALNMVYEHQMRWIRDIELGLSTLPSEQEMWADIAAKNRWQSQTYRHSPRHTIEEEHVPYILELKRSIREMRKRRDRDQRVVRERAA